MYLKCQVYVNQQVDKDVLTEILAEGNQNTSVTYITRWLMMH